MRIGPFALPLLQIRPEFRRLCLISAFRLVVHSYSGQHGCTSYRVLNDETYEGASWLSEVVLVIEARVGVGKTRLA